MLFASVGTEATRAATLRAKTNSKEIISNMQHIDFWSERHTGRRASSSFLYSNAALTGYAFVYICGIGVTDLLSANGLDFTFFYLIGSAFAGWISGARAGIWCAVVSGIFSYCANSRLSGVPHAPWITFWNSTVNLMAFMVVSLLAAQVGR